MNYYNSKEDGLAILTLYPFDLYESVDDRIEIKDKINELFASETEIFCYFRRIEDMTDERELSELQNSIFTKFDIPGNEFEYLFALDETRFDAIGKLKINNGLANTIIDLWKYFYSFCFFSPTNDLTFNRYKEYLEKNGFDDKYGVNHVLNGLAKFICVKGGIDNLVITFGKEYSD